MGETLCERAFHPFLAKFTCTLNCKKALSPTSSLPPHLDLFYMSPSSIIAHKSKSFCFLYYSDCLDVLGAFKVRLYELNKEVRRLFLYSLLTSSFSRPWMPPPTLTPVQLPAPRHHNSNTCLKGSSSANDTANGHTDDNANVP